MTGQPTINSDNWREGYAAGQKSMFANNEQTHRDRFEKMGILDWDRDLKILDLGCGDGNLIGSLKKLGFDKVRGVEPDAVLAESSPYKDVITIGKASSLEFEDATFDAVIVMAALHHLENDHELVASLNEIKRVLKPNGILTCCEPADTLMRQILTKVLMSPLASLTSFSRKKQAMVRGEWETLNWWLAKERQFDTFLRNAGFVNVNCQRESLKVFYTASKSS